MTPERFQDRTEAGRLLGERLDHHRGRPGVVVLALPRGGLPVGLEVAKALHAPLDVFLVRKLGVPGHEELAMGAIASGGVRVLNEAVIASLGIDGPNIDRVSERERQELERREAIYRGDRRALELSGKTMIVVDDGLATGSSMRAAVVALRRAGPERIVVGVPTAAPQTVDELRGEVDEVVAVITPEPYLAVGAWYDDFAQLGDAEVKEILGRAPKRGAGREEDKYPESTAGVRVSAGRLIEGDLTVPQDARGAVLFAHGSGSSRFSPRNRLVADVLVDVGLATLLIDLLTPQEEEIDFRTAELRFDILLLAERLESAARWLRGKEKTRGLPIGYFGASTGAAAALVAAARSPEGIAAIVSRGGRPDLAGDYLRAVEAPTLLIVGGNDTQVLDLNRGALEKMPGNKQLEVVPGASHLFEEPGALDRVAELARDWFTRLL